MQRNKRQPTPTYLVRRPAAAYSWLVSVILLGGLLCLASGIAAQRSVFASQAIGEMPSSSRPTATPGRFNEQYAAYSEPTAIHIPAIGVVSKILSVGKTPEGAMEVPKGADFDKAAWYRYSPSPGQHGASVIIGHVDSYASQSGSVFYNLGKLKPEDQITVSRQDGSRITFIVQAIRDYGKDALPHDIVYGPINNTAELRLITCSGPFNDAKGDYERNTVVFARAITAANVDSFKADGPLVY